MTQEEKAKAYDERLAKARKEYSIHEANNAIGIMDALERVFPELYESEDEKIRKWIMKELESKYVVDNIVNNGMADKALVWLETQGEQKPDNVPEPKFCIGDVVKRGLSTLRISSINFKKRFYELSTKEGIVVSCVPFSEQDNWELVAKNTTIRPKYCVMSNSPYCPYYNKHQHAWSEEDEKVLSDIIKDLVHPWNEYIPDRIEDEIKWLKNKLKSIKDRCTWKPSDEQIEALVSAIDVMIDNRGAGDKNTILLSGLYHELKKLREE